VDAAAEGYIVSEEGERGPSELGRNGRFAAGIVAAILVLSVLGVVAYVAWPRGATPPGPALLSPPSNVVADAGEERITLSWDSVAGAAAYHVYGASAPGVTKEGYATMPDGARFGDVIAPYTVSGLAAGRTYYFRVTAENAAGESDVSGEISVTPVAPLPGPTAPSPPTDVRAIAGEGRVTVEWSPVEGALSYNLYRASAPGVTKDGYASMPDGVRYASVLSPYTILGVEDGKTYYFRVTATNGVGESGESGEASATPVAPGPTVPSPPMNVLASAGEGLVTISWDAVAGALSYHLYGASAPGVTKEGYAAMPDGVRHPGVLSPYTVTGLRDGTTYYFRVTAENAVGESGVSGEASATPVAPAPMVPSPPTGVLATAEDGRVTVAWNPVVDALAYHLYAASAPGVTRDGYGSMPDGARFQDVLSPYTIAGLTNGKTYYFRVTAENAAGESAESGEASATPVAPSPQVNLYVTGLVELDSGAPAADAQVSLRMEDGTATALGLTAADGRFNLGMSAAFPDRVLAEVTYRGAVGPAATGFRWSPLLESGGAVDVGRIVLPDATGKRLTMAGSTAWSPDGSIVAMNFPANVDSLWARPYDPDATPDVFPGDLAEGRDLPLNSVVFTWISALDAAGQPVVDLGSPATVRMRIPRAQWVDAEDLQPGNGVIDTPIYSLDYATGYWVREADGLLTDAAGAPIPESEEMAIRMGDYAGEVYAEFLAGHFSWWNVDKPPTNCKPDFGDADDPPYPSLLASDGARHLDICRAWLGAWVDGEDDADVPDADAYDDGLLARNPLTVRVSNWNWSTKLYLNALIDGNADGDWTDADEWVLQNLPVSVSPRKGKAVVTDLVWDGETWLRLTVTGAPIQGYDGTGEFAIGETEDYPFIKQRLSVWVSGNGTVTSDPPGIDCRKDSQPGTCLEDYRVGTSVTLTAAPDAGESFIGWDGPDCRGSNATCTVVMDTDRSTFASFTQPYYRLTVYVIGNNGTQYGGGGNVTSEPPGIRCGGNRPDPGGNPANCTAVFPRGTNVTLTAIPDPGWVFMGWGGDCTGTSPTCTLTMDRDRWVTAFFMKP